MLGQQMLSWCLGLGSVWGWIPSLGSPVDTQLPSATEARRLGEGRGALIPVRAVREDLPASPSPC